MLIGIISWALVSSLILVLTLITFLHLKTDRGDINWILFTFLGIFYTTLAMFVFGKLGVMRPLPMMAFGLAGFAVLLFVPSARSDIQAIRELTEEVLDAVNNWWKDFPRWLKWLTAAFLLASVVRFTFLILALPPFVWDSLTYHLTNVAEWTQRGRITLFETSMARIYTPANYETFTLWFTAFLYHDVIVEAAGLPAYALALASVYSIGRSLKLAPWSAWFAGLAYLSTPALVIAVTGTKNDPHMAAYFLGLLALLLYLESESGDLTNPKLLGVLIIAALMASLAFGTKAYLMHITPGLILVALIGIQQRGGWHRWVGMIRSLIREWRGKSVGFRTAILGLLVSGLVLGLYWNLRNWVDTGNPFYPYGVRVEAVEVLSGVDRTAALSFQRLRENTESLIWKFGDRQERISPDLTDATGWGWVVYGLGMPAMLWGFLRRRDLRVLLLGFLLSLTLILMSIRPSPWNMRYLLWFPAIFLLALSAWMEFANRHVGIPFRMATGLAVVGIALNLLVVWNYGRISVEDFERMLSLPLLQRGSAQLSLNMPREYANTLDIVSEEDLLGYNVGENGFIYPLYRPDYSQAITYIPINQDSTCQEIAAAMVERGTRYLFVAPVHTRDSVLGILNSCGASAEYLQEFSFNLYVLKD